MENGWNFQGWIALPLENYARRYLGKDISADSIALGKFVDIMLEILSVSHIEPSDLKEFKKACKKYKGVTRSEIPKEDAKELFDWFKALMGLQ